MASREATGPIGGGSVRFNDIRRELTVCQTEWPQHFVEAACQDTRGALHMKTEAAVPHQKCHFIRKSFSA